MKNSILLNENFDKSIKERIIRQFCFIWLSTMIKKQKDKQYREIVNDINEIIIKKKKTKKKK